jgi:hypothetical protein
VRRPRYTCPSCRAGIYRAPVECFVLKNVVRAVGARDGEQEPHLPTKRGNRFVSESAKVKSYRDKVWDRFFGRE